MNETTLFPPGQISLSESFYISRTPLLTLSLQMILFVNRSNEANHSTVKHNRQPRLNVKFIVSCLSETGAQSQSFA